jgi:hypothetical protein
MASGHAAQARTVVAVFRTHLVCLRCRRSFKVRVTVPSRPCPDCGEAMIDAGPCLAVPPRRDERGWRALAAVLNAGLDFKMSCACCYDGPGYRPRTLSQVKQRLQHARRHRITPAEALKTADV